MTRAISFVIFSFCTLVCLAQNAAWQRSIGGAGDDYGRAIVAVDGGYVIAGSTNSFFDPSTDIYLIKIDEEGNYVWGRNYGAEGLIEWALSLASDSQGNLVMAGFTNNSNGNGYDGLIAKTDPEGNLLWTQHYGGQDWDFFYAVAVDQVDHIYAAGQLSTDSGQEAWMVKTNPNGVVEWEQSYSCEGEGSYSAIDMCSGGLVAAGTCSNTSEDQLFLSRFDPEGNVDWTIFPEGFENARSSGLRCSSEQSFVITANLELEANENNFLNRSHWARFSAVDGSLIWNQISNATEPRELRSVHSRENGDVLVAGSVFGVGFGLWDGNSFWFNSNGFSIPGINFPVFGGPQDDRFYDIAPSNSGGYIAVGETNSYGNGHQVMVVKVGPNGEVSQNNIDFLDIATRVIHERNPATVRCWPNPTRDQVQLSWPDNFAEKAEFQLLDMSGRSLLLGSVRNKQYISLRGVAVGPYVLRVELGGYPYTQRIIILE